jgi:hypothetical protein
MSRSRAVATALLVSLLAVGIAAVVVGRSVWDDPPLVGEASPSVSATPRATVDGLPSEEPDASEPTDPSPEPVGTNEPVASAAPDAELAATFAEIESQVEELRRLPPADIGPPDLLTTAQLRSELEAQFEADYSVDERQADNVTLRALGLIGADEDIAELQLDLLGEQVLGFYDDELKRMVVVSDAGLTPLAKLTYAHEYVHALQDAHFGLPDLEPVGDDDLGLAGLSLAEGDATTAMLQWAFRHLEEEELATLGSEPTPDTSQYPEFLTEMLEFPYTAGSEFVTQLLVQGGTEAVDAAYADLPRTTEQVMHPERYVDREAGLAVGLPDLSAALGAGWAEVDRTTFGEATVLVWLDALGLDAGGASAAATGWGGDLMATATSGDQFALALRIAWDSEAEAGEFLDAFAEIEGQLPYEGQLVILQDGSHLVVRASSEGLVQAVITAVSEGS